MLPSFYDNHSTTIPISDKTQDICEDHRHQPEACPRWRTASLLVLGIWFYFLSCGIDSYFQSNTYTYGLCGPLSLSASTAGWLNTVYFGLYLAGRIISVPLSTVISPSGIIITSLIGCLSSAGILVSLGADDPVALFVATGLMGFSICFQFGSGITWLASNIPQMTSRQVSLIFFGSNVSNCVFPLLASKLFNDVGPAYVFYMTMICIVALICTFFAMIMAANYQMPKKMKSSIIQIPPALLIAGAGADES